MISRLQTSGGGRFFASSSWLLATIGVGCAWIGVLTLYWPTARTLMHAWSHSVSYQHGWAILPICLYLIWRQRHALMSVEPKPFIGGVLLMVPLTATWLLGNMANIVLVQEVSLVLMLQTLTVSLLGVAAGRILAFPLLYLLFAVPVGEDLIPVLQDYTAWFTVKALQLTGVPVYREGHYLMVPTGAWEVAKSCAGIRYILPSLALGTLFAMLTYRSWIRRSLFLLACLIVPILANGMRAYGIVMLAYLTDNALAVGVDHFIYGGVFFGVVMFVLFSIGLRWRERPVRFEAPPHPIIDDRSSASARYVRSRPGMFPVVRLVSTAVLALAVSATGPVLAKLSTGSDAGIRRVVALPPPAPDASWELLAEQEPVWEPRFAGYEQTFTWLYRNVEGEEVQLYIAWYPIQRQGAELVQSRNTMYDPARWRLSSHTRRTIVLDDGPLTVDEWLLRSTSGMRLVWSWYWIGGAVTADPYWAKWLELRNRLRSLFDEPGEAALIALSTSTSEMKPEAASERLQSFLAHVKEPLGNILAGSFGDRNLSFFRPLQKRFVAFHALRDGYGPSVDPLLSARFCDRQAGQETRSRPFRLCPSVLRSIRYWNKVDDFFACPS
ncbi:MAG: exosortase A [Nitrospirae bacterium]|nr:MAG: exosortase A [Nitrospirota bacterium]